MDNTLPALLEERITCAAPALYDREHAVSYAALAQEAQRVAAGLTSLGIREGDRVALWLPNVTGWLAGFFACAHLGAIAVAVNTRFRSHELGDVLRRTGSRVVFFWPGFPHADFVGILGHLAEVDPSALESVEALVLYGEEAALSEEAALPVPRASKRALSYSALGAGNDYPESRARPGSPCAIFTTSGTTGPPKFALHTQRSLRDHAFDASRSFRMSGTSALLLGPPLCGVFGLCSALAAIAAQAPVVMNPSWNAGEAAHSIDKYQITHLNATDDMIAQLLAQHERTPAFPSLGFAGFAAFSPVQSDIVARADARGLTLVGLYGTSEIQALFARQDPAAGAEDRSLAGGWPVSPLAQVRARDPDSGRVLSHDEPGELEFFAPSSSMAEYFGDPAATAAAISPEGWYRSGDLGYTRADGRFVYLARMGDSLRLGGFLVSPLEIEGVLQALPEVCACQVVAVMHEGGLRPVAFVTLKAGAQLDEAAAIGHVAARLARYKVPIRVLAIDAFPTTEGTNATKIQKHKLRVLAQEHLRST